MVMTAPTPTCANDAAGIDSTTRANNSADKKVRMELIGMWFLWLIHPSLARCCSTPAGFVD